MTKKLSPTNARIVVLDILRGFTICGILFTNFILFNGYMGSPREVVDTVINVSFLDHSVLYAIRMFALGIFYYLFSFLFGLGFGIQMARATEKNSNFHVLYTRRLAFLFLIGLFHAVFFFYGDILRYYALIGFILLAFRYRSDKAILYTAISLLLLPILLATTKQLLFPGHSLLNMISLPREHISSVYSEGTYINYLMLHWDQIKLHFFRNLENGRFMKILALFLLGYYTARKGIFQDTVKYAPLFKKMCIIGVSIGLITSFIRANFSYMDFGIAAQYRPIAREIIYFFAVPTMAMFYLSSIVLLCHTRYLKLLSPLAAVGRMALTNYVSQAIIFSFIFKFYGLGLYGRLSLSETALLVTGIAVFQIIVSNLWFNYFKFGPLEWLWRSLTYGQWQAMRKHRQPDATLA